MRRAIVALDCTGETYSCSLLVQEKLHTSIAGFTPRRALRELPGHLGYLLDSSDLSYTDLEAVGVTCGPGSFTGVRLGITLAKTIASAANCQIAALDTLEVISHGVLRTFPQPGHVAVALDARRGELYCGLYQSKRNELGGMCHTGVRTPEEFREMVEACQELRGLVGEGFAAYPDLVPAGFQGPVLSERAQSMPSMLSLCDLTLQSLREGRLQDWKAISPVYLRQADIQVSGGSPSA
jgi:tRNA threonylcarbamoyladenosine biosynthesis protein TsaB